MVRSIILKKTDRGEADELVVFLSRDLGWLRGVAKNAKKSRVRFGGHLEPLSLVDLTLRPRRKDDLVWVGDSQVIRGFLGLRSDLGKIALASYFLEMCSLLMLEGNPDSRIFDFILEFLENLEKSDLHPERFLLDEIRLLGLLGHGPRFDTCVTCGEPIGPGEDALFSPGLGGVNHNACEDSRATDLTLSPDTLAFIRRGLELKGDAASRVRLNRKGLAELRRSLSSFVRHVRGQEIRSLVFLEKLRTLSGL